MALFTDDQRAAITAAEAGFNGVLGPVNEGRGLIQSLGALDQDTLVVAGAPSAEALFAEAVVRYEAIKAAIIAAANALP